MAPRITRVEVAAAILAKTILFGTIILGLSGIGWTGWQYWRHANDPRASISDESNVLLKSELDELNKRKGQLDIAANHAAFRLANTNLLNGVFTKGLPEKATYRLLSLKIAAQTEYRQDKQATTSASSGERQASRILTYQVEARWRFSGSQSGEDLRQIVESILRGGRPDFQENGAFVPWSLRLTQETITAPGSAAEDEIYEQTITGPILPPEGEPYKLRPGKTIEDRWATLNQFFKDSTK